MLLRMPIHVVRYQHLGAPDPVEVSPLFPKGQGYVEAGSVKEYFFLQDFLDYVQRASVFFVIQAGLSE